VTGFLKDENVIGRPAEVAEDADGAIYVSDDYANAVYRIVPGGNQTLDVGQAHRTGGATADGGVVDQKLIARGATVFGQRACQECHALEGDGKDGRVVLAGLATRYDPTSLASYLAQPRPPMPPVEDAQMRTALAAFLLQRPQHGTQ